MRTNTIFAVLLTMLLFTASLFSQQVTFNSNGDAKTDFQKEVLFTFTCDSGGTATSSRFQLNDFIKNSNLYTTPFVAWYTTTVSGLGPTGDTTAYKAILKGYANGAWYALDTITVANTATTVSGIQSMNMNNWRGTDYLWYITSDASASAITSGKITIIAIKPD